ncbi:hypothetical protein OBBRIDRAFT_529783 [Obba rivulosa]|uniref:Uncharacterized protein n=1 Tax=Obba rivulosa TaxID=1052685 RepID=A0A8E2AUR2_9APHY|nr:hypothetical protein OBBRIDRAFT_529783 [Obba rivulosa]
MNSVFTCICMHSCADIIHIPHLLRFSRGPGAAATRFGAIALEREVRPAASPQRVIGVWLIDEQTTGVRVRPSIWRRPAISSAFRIARCTAPMCQFALQVLLVIGVATCHRLRVCAVRQGVEDGHQRRWLLPPTCQTGSLVLNTIAPCRRRELEVVCASCAVLGRGTVLRSLGIVHLYHVNSKLYSRQCQLSVWRATDRHACEGSTRPHASAFRSADCRLLKSWLLGKMQSLRGAVLGAVTLATGLNACL